MTAASSEPQHVVLYDDDCAFCKWSLDKILAWDRRRRLRPVAIQSDEGQGLLASVPESERLDSWHLVLPSGEVRSAGAAAAPLAGCSPAGRPLAFLFRPSPASPTGPTAASPRTAIASRAGSESTRAASFGGSPGSNCDAHDGTQFDHRRRKGWKEGPVGASNSYSVGGLRLHVSREDGENATGAGGAELRRGNPVGCRRGARRASPYGSRASPTERDRPLANRRHERRWIRDAQRGSGRRSRPSTGATGRGPTGPRTSSFTTRPRPRTSRRRRSWRRCGRSTASIAAARSAPGCTGSWSTGRSTGRAPARCARRPRWSRSRRPSGAWPGETREPERSRPYSESVVAALASLSPEHRAVVVLRYLLEYTPGEIAEALELPRGTVNSRLRRALDRLGRLLKEER